MMLEKVGFETPDYDHTNPCQPALGQQVEDSGPFLSMNYFNETPAVPFGSTDLNQSLTSLLTGRGDVLQMRLPNQERREDKFTTLQIATYNVLTLSDERVTLSS